MLRSGNIIIIIDLQGLSGKNQARNASNFRITWLNPFWTALVLHSLTKFYLSKLSFKVLL